MLESGDDNENAIVTIFGNNGHTKRSFIGFGVEQVILVRDDSARNEIYKYVGKQALVLTIVECKGLENKEEFAKLMFDYWRKKAVVQVRKLDNSLALEMQVASSPEEWKSRGNKVCWLLFILIFKRH